MKAKKKSPKKNTKRAAQIRKMLTPVFQYTDQKRQRATKQEKQKMNTKGEAQKKNLVPILRNTDHSREHQECVARKVLIPCFPCQPQTRAQHLERERTVNPRRQHHACSTRFFFTYFLFQLRQESAGTVERQE